MIFSIKAGGNVQSSFIRDLRGVLEREGAEIGVCITMTEPTQEMRREAATGGFYDSAWGHHPRLQILTIGELLEGQGVNMPPISQVNVTFKREGRGERERGAEGADVKIAVLS